ncbi:S8 family peptidase [Solirubrobacter soli]|uniref:S8 family peptidase n=1 Tax=Solirubrobacter soli TaxID=363832 RepID=UPI0003F58DF6|nr:S8 family serine peptidase [Solirubrobacter soli]
MKPHVIIRLRDGAQAPDVASWQESIADKGGAQASLTPAIDAVLRRHGVPVWVTREYAPAGERWTSDELTAKLDRIYRLILREQSAIPAGLVEDISLVPEVEYARAGRVGVTDLAPAAAQSVRTDSWSREAIGLPDAHRWGTGRPEITVAVLDTGVDVRHPELAKAVVPGHDFVDILDGAGTFLGDFLDADTDPEDPVGHGTHVSGIIAGAGERMPTGVAPGCRLLPVRVLGAMRQGGRPVGAGLVDNINTGLKWAIDQGAHVINMSFGLPRTGSGLPHAEVVEYGLRRGVVMVAAAGNDGHEKLYYPGSLPGVIAVGASDPQDAVAAFSTYGPQVLLTAPGTDIYSSFPDAGYAFASGTSQAAPFVTGAAALLQSAALEHGRRRLGVGDLRRLLVATADRTDAAFRTVRGGHGRVNVADALRLLDLMSAQTDLTPERTTA